jgi:acetolactate synthase-1/2/3 large subunit
MKLSDYIVSYLVEKKIALVFGYIGGAITHIVDSITRSSSLQYVQVYHEQTAAIAAEGVSRNSSSIGVAIATSGPGATNLITGIADAYFDSIPTLFITGQVNTYEYKYSKPIRQQGFQETDIVSIVKPITKYAKMIDRPEIIRYELDKAIYLANHGRKGPVLLDIPMDIQRSEIDINNLKKFAFKKDIQKIGRNKINHIIKLLNNAKRPMILCGGGIISSDAKEELLSFADKYELPVAVTLMGKGAFPEDNKNFVGFIGSYGNRCANMILANSDLLISIGARLDTRQTGTSLKSFIRSGKIIRIDIDKNELLYHRLKNVFKLLIDAKQFLQIMNNNNKIRMNNILNWIDYIKGIKNNFSQEKEVSLNIPNKLPYQIIKLLSDFSSSNQIFTIDIGQNQMFSAQMLKIKKGQKFFTSGGMAPMGYALPIAIGASFANNKSENIFAITGDGGFHIATQSLMLISQYNLPIKVIVLNNQSLGMIVQFQDLYFEKRMGGTTKESGYCVPDIAGISAAYQIKYYQITEAMIQDVPTIKKILTETGPSIIEVILGTNTSVFPKLEVNTPLEDVSPKLDRDELKKSMLIDLY